MYTVLFGQFVITFVVKPFRVESSLRPVKTAFHGELVSNNEIFISYEAFFCNSTPQWELMEFRASVKKYLHSLSQLDCTNNYDCTFCRLYKFIELLPQFATLTQTYKMHRVEQISTSRRNCKIRCLETSRRLSQFVGEEIYNVVPFLFINYRIYMALDETMKTILTYV